MGQHILSGEEALAALVAGTDEDGGGDSNKFTSLKTGSSFTVKVPGLAIISAFVYNNYENPSINSFVAERESKKSAKGFPVENLTPFDLAWKYYKDKSDHYQDEMSAKAGVFKADHKFTLGFFNLDDGEPIKVEFSKNQASVLVNAIQSNKKYHKDFAFTLAKTKTGSSMTSVTVSLTLIPMLDELTDEQCKNFEELPNEFDLEHFKGLHFLKSEEDMIKQLHEVGFDLSLIDLELPKEESKDATEGTKSDGEENDGKPLDISDDDLPF